MNEIKFDPVGRTYMTRSQKRERYINRLKCWIAILAFADIIYTVLIISMIYEVIS